MPAYEKSRSTGAEDGMGVLYLTNIFLTVGYRWSISTFGDLSSKYLMHSMSVVWEVSGCESGSNEKSHLSGLASLKKLQSHHNCQQLLVSPCLETSAWLWPRHFLVPTSTWKMGGPLKPVCTQLLCHQGWDSHQTGYEGFSLNLDTVKLIRFCDSVKWKVFWKKYFEHSIFKILSIEKCNLNTKIQNTQVWVFQIQNTKCIWNTYFNYKYFKYCPALPVVE